MKTNSSQKTVIIVLAVLLVLALIFGGIQLSRSNALRSQLNDVTETLDSKSADLAAAADELESTKAALADLTEAQQTENEAKAEALRVKEAELESAKAELEATIAALEEAEGAQSAKDAELASAKAELESVKTELESVKAELAELGTKQQASADALIAKEAELAELTAKQQASADALSAKEAELAELTAKQQETADALSAKEAELEAAVAALNEMTAKQQETENALAEARAVHQHVWGAWEVDIAPSCEAEGREIRYCQDDSSHDETRLIPALGHDWSPATFTQPKTCTRCGETSGKSSPESSFPTMEDVRFMSQNSAITRVSNTDNTRLQLPAETSYLSEPYRAKLSNNIYIMPIPQLGHGHLGIVKKGTEVAVVAKRNGYVFFVTYDGRMGWNGSQLVG